MLRRQTQYRQRSASCQNRLARRYCDVSWRYPHQYVGNFESFPYVCNVGASRAGCPRSRESGEVLDGRGLPRVHWISIWLGFVISSIREGLAPAPKRLSRGLSADRRLDTTRWKDRRRTTSSSVYRLPSHRFCCPMRFHFSPEAKRENQSGKDVIYRLPSPVSPVFERE